MDTGIRCGSLPAGSMVFCDFDGTITERDTLQAVCQAFIPDVAARVLPAIGQRRISLREGVSELIENLPSAAEDEIRRFVCREPLRKGFEVFARQLKNWNVPLVVLSGGMGFCVEARLWDWRHLIHGVHALHIDRNQTFMRARIRYGSGSEAVPKAEIMRAYQAGHRVVIGDSMSDQSMALEADRVFARDRLLTFMHGQDMAVEAFGDFTDILDALQAASNPGDGGVRAAARCDQ